jgi:protein ImuB
VRPLPVAALRLPDETLATLARLGIATVGDLLRLPRAELPARFGPGVLRRLDQALGRLPEPIVPHGVAAELRAGYRFEYPTDRLADLLHVVDRLAGELHAALDRRNLGARQVECRLYHEAGPPLAVAVGLYRPTSCPRYLGELLRTRLESLQLAGLVCAMRLSVPWPEHVAESQHDLFDTGRPDEPALAELIDRLTNRLGCQSVTRARCVADAQPEYACAFEPILAPGGSGRAATVETDDEPCEPRPLSLWPAPVPVEAWSTYPDGPPRRFRWEGIDYRAARCWGPERIETGWWRGADVRRDYFVVATDDGGRFWLFRAGDGRWFLHGCFD